MLGSFPLCEYMKFTISASRERGRLMLVALLESSPSILVLAGSVTLRVAFCCINESKFSF